MNRLLRIFTTASLGIALVACSQESNSEPQLEAKGETIELTTTLALELPEVEGLGEDELKALNYRLDANGSSLKPMVQFTEGQTVPVLCIIRNEATRSTARPVLIQEVPFTYTNGQLVAKSKPITMPAGADLVANPNGWRMVCIVGHDSYSSAGTGSVQFSSQSTLPTHASAGQSRQIKTLYMNKDKGGSASWTKLAIERGADGLYNFQATETTRLSSVGSMFLITVENPTNRAKLFQGLEVESNTIGFSASLSNLLSATVAQGLPKFAPATGTKYHVGLAAPLTVNAGGRVGTYVFYGIPDRLTTKQTTLTSFTGTRFTRAKTYRYSFSPEANRFYNLKLAHISSNRTHPIEAIMTDGRSNTVYATEKKSYSGTPASAATFTEDGEYFLPTESEARVLFPGLVPDESKTESYNGNGAYGLVNFGDGKTYTQDIYEDITAFGQTDEYRGEYTNPAGSNVSYALRFMEGRGNEYFSAYRYERLGTASNPTGVKITVRVLGPTRTSTTLADISKESYWSTAPVAGQKQIVREIPTGAYWTTDTHDVAANAKSNIMIRVFETTGHTYTDAARGSVYVTDYLYHYRSPNIGSNEFPYLLFARTRD